MKKIKYEHGTKYLARVAARVNKPVLAHWKACAKITDYFVLFGGRHAYVHAQQVSASASIPKSTGERAYKRLTINPTVRKHEHLGCCELLKFKVALGEHPYWHTSPFAPDTAHTRVHHRWRAERHRSASLGIFFPKAWMLPQPCAYTTTQSIILRSTCQSNYCIGGWSCLMKIPINRSDFGFGEAKVCM